MKFIPVILLSIALSVFMSSCATSPQTLAPAGIAAQMAQRGVPASTQKRIQAGRVLDFDDIMSLAKAGVSDKAIVAYLKSTKAPYKLTTAQLEQLTNAGAGSTLVNYLGQSVGYYELRSGIKSAEANGTAIRISTTRSSGERLHLITVSRANGQIPAWFLTPFDSLADSSSACIFKFPWKPSNTASVMKSSSACWMQPAIACAHF